MNYFIRFSMVICDFLCYSEISAIVVFYYFSTGVLFMLYNRKMKCSFIYSPVVDRSDGAAVLFFVD